MLLNMGDEDMIRVIAFDFICKLMIQENLRGQRL